MSNTGKQKATTVKNNMITERWKGSKVKYLSQTVEGERHDKKLADEEKYQFPKGSKLWKDTGFQGYEPEDVMTFQPEKKPRGNALTEEEKKRNQELSRSIETRDTYDPGLCPRPGVAPFWGAHGSIYSQGLFRTASRGGV